ncbi:MAG: sigma-70 family RNA polymerase sigma factor [Acidobacteriota bacterium]
MSSSGSEEIRLSVDHLFRHHAGQMVATLTRIFGIERLDQVEDAVQDALVTALRRWPYEPVPQNPLAWLIQVAKNRMLDRVRHDRRNLSEETLTDSIRELVVDSREHSTLFTREMQDDQLRLIFTCCHPAIPPDSQVALTLKTVGGFSASEIARAFLAREAAVTKMLVRARQRLREKQIALAMPLPASLPARLDSVLQVLYLMFNEGYSALEGEELVRTDLCYEAMRLSALLAAHPSSGTPKTHALAALLFFQGARLGGRAGKAGELLILAEQDRSLWNPSLLRLGLMHLKSSARGDEVTDYHLEAEIASCHALAETFDATDWFRVLACYEELLRRNPSPVVALNRVVALARVMGAEAGLRELEKLHGHRALRNYYPLFATHGELLRQAGRTVEASESYRGALALTSSEPVRKFLIRRITETTPTAGAAPLR